MKKLFVAKNGENSKVEILFVYSWLMIYLLFSLILSSYITWNNVLLTNITNLQWHRAKWSSA
jgi:hypothetical protein